MIRYTCFLFALAIPSAFADQLTGCVISIADGDTVTPPWNWRHRSR